MKGVTDLMIAASEGDCSRLKSIAMSGGQDGYTEVRISALSGVIHLLTFLSLYLSLFIHSSTLVERQKPNKGDIKKKNIHTASKTRDCTMGLRYLI